MGWTINPNNGLASIDNNGHVTFLYHASDVTYTVRYTDGTCDKSKEVLVKGCYIPEPCNCTVTPSGSANELPAETSNTEYEVATYTSTNCSNPDPVILFESGTDFLGNFRNSNGKTYAKVILENTDTNVRTGTYLFVINNCRTEVTFTQVAAAITDSCNIQRIGGSGKDIPRTGGSLNLVALGCGGKNCMKVSSEEEYYYGYGYAYVYTFYIENPPTPIDYRQGSLPIITNSNGVDVTSQFSVVINNNNIVIEAQQSAGVSQGVYTMYYTNTSAGITDCATDFLVYWDYCRYANPSITQTTFSAYGGNAYIYFDTIDYMSINVTSNETWCQIMNYGGGQYRVVVQQNTTQDPRDAVVTVKINNEVCKTFNIHQLS